MKQIDFQPAPHFKLYDNQARYSKIKDLVQRDDYQFLENIKYREFFDYVHDNPLFHQQVQYLRYMNTAGTLFSTLGDIQGKDILELGGYSPLSVFLASNNNCYHTESDLRMEIDAPDNSIDIIICCEVIEHIKDLNPRNLQELTVFTTNGVKRLVKEVSRVLRENGILLLTTPNANSLWSVIRSIRYQDPYVFRGHVREYTRAELEFLFSDYEVLKYESYFNFRLVEKTEREVIEEKFESIGWDTEFRGDNHFFLFRRQS